MSDVRRCCVRLVCLASGAAVAVRGERESSALSAAALPRAEQQSIERELDEALSCSVMSEISEAAFPSV